MASAVPANRSDRQPESGTLASISRATAEASEPSARCGIERFPITQSHSFLSRDGRGCREGEVRDFGTRDGAAAPSSAPSGHLLPAGEGSGSMRSQSAIGAGVFGNRLKWWIMERLATEHRCTPPGPAGPWVQVVASGASTDADAADAYVCPECGGHWRLPVKGRRLAG